MSNYDLVLLDADNTLIDVDSFTKDILADISQRLGVHFKPGYEKIFFRINDALWEAYERDEIAHDRLVIQRFEQYLGEIGASADAAEFERLHEEQFRITSNPMKNSVEALSELSQYCTLSIVTNGRSETQHYRISLLRIDPYIDRLFVSEDFNTAKPDPKFFDMVLSFYPNIKKERVLMVGDSPSADIKGANLAGITACYFNLKDKPLPTGVFAKYEINDLLELQNIVLK